MDQEWALQRESITRALLDRHGGRTRDEWVDHYCLFHQDRHRSATWNESHGVYWCRKEDKTYLVAQVLERLLIPQPARRKWKQPVIEPTERLPPITQATIYTYLWPDGRPSHLKLRWGDGRDKIIRQTDLDFTWHKPADAYPFYGDYGLPAEAHLVVVEGEKCVDAIRRADDSLGGHPIRAITAGSAADLRSSGIDLVARMGTLHPSTITLWPDNDESGAAAIRYIHQEAARQNLAHSTIAPAELGLPLKGDVVDFLDAGGSLSVLLAKQSGVLESEPVVELARKIIVTRDGHFMWPEMRIPTGITNDNVEALWYQTYHALPKQNQRRELMASLIDKTRVSPTHIRSRMYTNEQVTWWRPEPSGAAYRISAQGVELDTDPPDVFLSVPEDDGRHTPTAVDLEGSIDDLHGLLEIWRFNDTELAMIHGWLVCAMGNLQTPILFIKSPAGTGKTTLARWLAAVIEPFASEPEARIMKDERQFLRQVMAHPVMLVDNVSRVESMVEDTLSRLVTGAAFSIRPLYEDRLVEMFLRRAVILTTTNYDIYKGDLASRTVVLEPQRRVEQFFADRELQKRVRHLFPKVRGFVMRSLSTYFEKRDEALSKEIPFRIGDLGTVFVTLGYDVSLLARQEALARSAVMTNDPWVEAIVELWKDADSLMIFKTTREVLDHMRAFGIHDVPPEKSPRLARWFAEKTPFFADHGFTVERVMTDPRGYRFRVSA